MQEIIKTEVINDRTTHQELTLELIYKVDYDVRPNIGYSQRGEDVYINITNVDYNVYIEGLLNNSYYKEIVCYDVPEEDINHFKNKHIMELRDDYILNHYGERELEVVDLLEGYGDEYSISDYI